MAPMLPAAPMAASPATPAPTTSTLAGGTLPAAVTCPVKNRPKACAASTTARYPAMLAIDDSTSSDCAREMRGTASIASTVIGRADSFSTSSGFSAGEIRLIRVARPQCGDLGVGGGVDLEYDVGGPARPTDLGAGLDVGGIGEAGGIACTGLDDDGVAQFDELSDGLRRGGDTRLTRVRLARYPDDHPKSLPSAPRRRACPSGGKRCAYEF